MRVPAEFPSPVRGILDDRMWQSIQARAMALPYCDECGRSVYPPAPCCPACLRFDLPWKKISGRGTIISWTRFHRSYLPAYPAPYNVIAVRLAENAVLISNLSGTEPVSWIGQPVRLVYEEVEPGWLLPRFVLDLDGGDGCAGIVRR